MKQRNVMAVVFLSIITLGIYDLFWLVSVKKELNAKTDVHTPSIWVLLAPFLVFLIPIVWLVVLAMAASSSYTTPSSTASSIASIVTVVLYLLAFLVILPVMFYWFLKFSKAVNHYTHGDLNTAVTFLLLWMLRFIGLAIIQDKFNDMIAAGNGSATAPASAVPTQTETVSQQPINPTAEQSVQAPAADAPSSPPDQSVEAAAHESSSSQPPATPQS